MNEFKRKQYLKYRKYDAIIMPQVIWIKTFYTSKRTSFFLYFFKTYFRIAQEEFKQPIKQLQYQFRSQN